MVISREAAAPRAPRDGSAWPALEQALDPGAMAAVLFEDVLGRSQVAAPRCSARVLAHKPGARCTLRYTLRDGHGGCVDLIGKLYRRQRLAVRVFSASRALGCALDRDGAPGRIPTQLALIPELGLVVQELVHGIDLRHALTAAQPVEVSARWLARLHGADPPAGLRVKSLEHELDKAERWSALVRPHLDDPGARRLDGAVALLGTLASALPAHEPVPIHRDFYYANLLWDGAQVWILDLDQLSLGHPARDVGHFLAELEHLGYRFAGRPGAFARPAERFLEAYRSGGSRDVSAAVPFFKASVLLMLAATEVNRRGWRWRRLAGALASLACDAVAEPAAPGGRS